MKNSSGFEKGLLSVAVALVSMLGSFAMESVSRAAPAASAPGTPAASEMPTAFPLPTSSVPPPTLFSLEGEPLHGAPPLSAHLRAHLSGGTGLQPDCRVLQWQFGDDREETLPCPQLGHGTLFEVDHTYAQTGTFHASARLIRTDGTELEAANTQTVVVAVPQPESPGDALLFWGTWFISVIAGALMFLWLRRQRGKRRTWGFAALALVLISAVPPFSYVPNPAGLYWAWLGNYSYDPRLPFVNRFVIAGDPTSNLRPFLDGLIGQTGLDPLDPVQPLTRYEFVEIRTPGVRGVLEVGTRLTYKDGSQRTFFIPLYQFDETFGFYQSNWRYDGLGRLRTEHRELLGTPFATASSPLRLGPPQRLLLDSRAEELDAHNPANWGPMGGPNQHLVWAPQGDAFLAMQTTGYDRTILWLVKTDGTPPVQLAENVREYVWSPNGQYVVFTNLYLRGQVNVVSRDGKHLHVLAQGPANETLPGLTREGVWFSKQGALWIAPYDGGAPQQLTALQGWEAPDWGPGVAATIVRPSPDEMRVAYSCGTTLCLQDRDGGNWVRVPLQANEVSWSSNGTRFAAVRFAYDQPALLTVIGREGTIEREVVVAPKGRVDSPQWTRDDRRLFVQTHPFDGRRIITIDATTGQALDLSQPRWDAWFALAPDSETLLLSNGRGGFWTSAILGLQGTLENNQP